MGTTKINAAMSKLAEENKDLADQGLEKVLTQLDKVPESLRGPIRNSGGGYVNHRLFWNIMAPAKGGEPSGELASAISSTFGSFDKFKEQFSEKAATVFGSGWAWLYVDTTTKPATLAVSATSNQDTPAMEEGKVPILGLDVWEHAYYLKYQNKRAAYIDAWWNVVNWDEVATRYEQARA